MIGEPQFSPDGKWLSYSKQDKQLRTHVWVKELATGQEHMIGGDEFLISSGAKLDARWKETGLPRRPRRASEASLNRTTFQLYSVALTPLDKDPNDRDINTEAQAEAAARRNAAAGRGGRGAGVAPANVQ